MPATVAETDGRSATVLRTRRRRRRILFRAILVLMVVVVVIVVAGVLLVRSPGFMMGTDDAAVVQQSDGPAGEVGTAIPTVEGQDFAGHDVGFGPGDGPLVVMFAAHWCEYCQADLEELAAARADGSFDPPATFIAVSTRHLPFVSWPPTSALDLGAADEVLVDTNSAIAREFGVSSVPQWYFIDSHGVVQERHTGTLSPDEVTELAEAATSTG